MAMGVKKNIFPVPTRPLEYVAFFDVKVRTLEGPAFIFMAYDAYSDFILSSNVEDNGRPETVLKNIYFLMKDSHFMSNVDRGFTLVLDKYEELSERIMRIIEPAGGKLMYDKAYNDHLSIPVLEHLSEDLKRNRM